MNSIQKLWRHASAVIDGRSSAFFPSIAAGVGCCLLCCWFFQIIEWAGECGQGCSTSRGGGEYRCEHSNCPTDISRVVTDITEFSFYGENVSNPGNAEISRAVGNIDSMGAIEKHRSVKGSYADPFPGCERVCNSVHSGYKGTFDCLSFRIGCYRHSSRVGGERRGLWGGDFASVGAPSNQGAQQQQEGGLHT